ncbi:MULTISPECIES: cytochrome c1 [Idiomarina]|jgi:ubiquinol-cytochrome c reductase cytochrome c1 subunit|uniref:Cytochrome C n=2 Tax=Idiomarina TaxID=135575 RepID=A0A837NFW2_9GAMM|nr:MULTISPECIES: cytochrome c1 [Idiomarina]KTG28531.1 cytochrome C [Idiomarina sp. H105]MBF39406.1 cytochrome c1 [Idiomarinaceae bacterium]OAF08059.1 cytochrome C [Idiomarina sp. WRN-38]ASG66555.1 cytochrome c1 [Idiomarina piscisalsi]KPD24210.1 cytochrome C [Idiomarina zobellii]|tara:strand:- start:646 stop:1380 length:735 start_codon:yes stop_codon:yes gene_type:complete
MKKLLIALMTLVPSLVFAAGPTVPLDEAEVDLHDKASLQRGAQLYMNYCLGCHQLQYHRYNRTFEDLGIPQELGEENLQFTGQKAGDRITNNMSTEAASNWFGTAAPDLTNVARVRGADWIYTYLRSFYTDDSRPFGVNNAVFPNVGMPHVLQELQGVPEKTYEERMIDGKMKDVYVGIKTDGSGRLSESEYDQAALDLTSFLVYMGEPMLLEQRRIGWFVFGFLLIFTLLAWFLKKEFWKDLK